MKQMVAEAEVLQRIMHLLEERSVGSAMRGNRQFERFIHDLYQRVEKHRVN